MGSSKGAYKSNSNTKRYKYFLGIRTDRLIFIICLFIASSFWLLIKLSHVYTVNYTLGVKYNNPPSSLRLTNVVDSTLDLSLTASGFAILKLNIFNDMDVLDIDLSNYTIDHEGGVVYSIVTQELITTLSELVNADKEDINFSRRVLAFELEKTGEKEVPVIPVFDIKFANQYDFYKDIVVEPSTVTVYGPQYVLDSLLNIKTEKLILADIHSDQIVEVELSNPSPNLLNFQDSKVAMHIEVEKFTESELEVPLNLSSISYKIKTFPSLVKVYYKVAQKDFNEVRAHQFNVVPIVDNLDILYAKKLPIKVDKHPDFVRNIRIVPKEVEFLIIK